MKQFDLVNFLNRFYGINSETLNNKKLSHKDIGILFPFIRTCPNWDVYEEDLIKGNIIKVYDKNNIVVYYQNPRLMIDYDDVSLTHKSMETVDIDNIENLSKDELLKLRRKCRLLALRKEAKMLTRMIHKKKQEEPKLYREKKEKIKLKEKDYD